MKLLLSPDAIATAPGSSGSAAVPVAAKPAAAPAPAPAKSSDSPPPKKPGIFDELDAIEPEQKPKPEPKKPDATAAPDPAKPAETGKPAVDPGKQMQGPKELRDYAKRLEGDVKAATARVAEYEKKLADAEASGTNTKALTERLATLEKQLAEREAKLYALDIEQSPEFQKNYVKPFDSAANRAQSQVEGLDVIETGADGEKTVRAGTFKDFLALYRLPFNKAVKAANAMYGDMAPVVIGHITKLQELDAARSEALRDAQETGVTKRKEEESKRIAEESSRKQQVDAMWAEINKDIENRHPEFQPDPEDAKEKEIRTKAANLVDPAFSGDRKHMTIEQSVHLDAEIRSRAIREPLLRYRLKKASAEITELKSVIEEMKGGKVGDTLHPGGLQAAAKPKSLDQELDELTD